MTAFLIFLCLNAAPHVRDTAAWTRPIRSTPIHTVMLEDHDFDVIHYDLVIEVLPDVEELDGTTGITLTSSGIPVSEIRLDLLDLTVNDVYNDTGPLVYSQVEDSVFITLESTVNPGDTTEIFIDYSGVPWNEGPGGFGGFWFNQSKGVYFQMGVGIYTDPPSLGKSMFPCWDHPSDKATFEFSITVDEGLFAVANGDLVLKKEVDGKAVYQWVLEEPMATYLVAIAVSDYVDLQDTTYDWIHYYVYPGEEEDAWGSFVNVDLMMDRYQNLYGPYPWNCKFSYVQTPKGDMEHTTEVYHIDFAINGNTYWDYLVAHEMSHQWWGNCVTELEWSDVWLSEGFATYSEAIWAEYYGQEEYEEYMMFDIMKPYLLSGEMFPLADPEELWGYTTYQKGASILHMLRYVIGDVDFFDVLNQHFSEFQYENCTTEDFRDRIETVTGDDIDWFFDTWVFDWGYPVYEFEYNWSQSGSDWIVSIGIDQIQTVGPVFEMPLEFLIEGSSSDTTVVFWNDLQSQSENFTVSFEPQDVVFDPDRHILCGNLLGVEEQANPPSGGVGLMRLYPNPALTFTSISWNGMENENLNVNIFDISGRLVGELTLTPDNRGLNISHLPSGTYLVEVKGLNLRQVSRLIVID